MTDQYWNRYCKLYVGVPGHEGLDLSELHIIFSVHQNDFESPNHAEIKVYNLSRDTLKRIQSWGEHAAVYLEAGYIGNNTGETIFKGTVSQMRVGREGNTDTFAEMLCMDGDWVNDNSLMVSTSVAAGATQDQVLEKVRQEVGSQMAIASKPDPSKGKYWTTAALRGKVLWGMPRILIRNIAQTVGHRWSIQNGEVQFIDQYGYLPGEGVVLNPSTGLIGTPTQTNEGIAMRSLLNPKIRIGTLVKLKNSLINKTIVDSMTAYDKFSGLVNVAPLSPDAVYCVLIAEHHGDTRGQEWYTDITAMAVDLSKGKLVLAA